MVSDCLGVQFLLGVWAKDLNSREDHIKRSVQGKLASATQKQTESYLKPLFRKLRKKVHIFLLDRSVWDDGKQRSQRLI